MQAVQTVSIAGALKALDWQDEDGTTWLAHNDPQWLAIVTAPMPGLDRTLHAMADALAVVAREATAASGPDSGLRSSPFLTTHSGRPAPRSCLPRRRAAIRISIRRATSQTRPRHDDVALSMMGHESASEITVDGAKQPGAERHPQS
jgi:hypothetical protein